MTAPWKPGDRAEFYYHGDNLGKFKKPWTERALKRVGSKGVITSLPFIDSKGRERVSFYADNGDVFDPVTYLLRRPGEQPLLLGSEDENLETR